jgi:putative FmdB family regulatory protein
MPTYDYECQACGHTFEEFQMMSEEPLTKCPACKKKKLKRLIGTGAAILFKGSGFYQTDYRSESYKSSAKAEEAKPKADAGGTADAAKSGDTTGTNGTAGGGGKKDSKPAAKSPKSKE